MRANAVQATCAALLVAACYTPAGHDDPHCVPAPSRLVSVDAATGAQRWARSLPHPYDAAPDSSGDLVLLTGCDATVLDPVTGQTVLRRPATQGELGASGGYLFSMDDGQVDATPVADRRPRSWVSTPPYTAATVLGNLLLLSRDSGLAAVGTAGGREWWRTTLPTLGEATFHRAGDVLVVAASDGSLYGVGPADGEVAWRAIPPPPALGFGRVLAAAPTAVVAAVDLERGGVVVALDPRTGAERWRLPAPGIEATEPVPWATTTGTLAVPSPALAPGTTGITAVGLLDGGVRWRLAAGGPAAVGQSGAIVVATEDGAVALDALTGARRWRLATSNPPRLTTARSGGVLVLDSPPVPYPGD